VSLPTRFSLANRALIALITLVAVGAGLYSAGSLRQELIPSLQLPLAAVVTSYPGASPEVVEQQVTDVVESAVGGVPGLEGTTSTSSSGLSVVTVELEYGTGLTTAQQDVQTAVTRAQRLLPEGADAQVITGSIDDLPVVQLAATGGASEADLAARLRDVVVPALEDVDGVRSVALSGTRADVVTLDVDPAALAAADLGPDAITTALTSNGVVVPAGSVTTGGRTLDVQVGQQLTSAADVAALPVGPDTLLSDVARVTAAPAGATSVTRTDGAPSIGVAVTKRPDGNTVEVSAQVAELLPELEDSLGEGGRLTVVFDQAPFIEQSVEDLAVEGLLGLGFAVLVILVFLLSVRSTLVTAVSIPLSLLIALVALRAGGYTLNLLTLSALTVSIGRVVDDAIVVVENIKRHLDAGEAKAAAIFHGTREVAVAITASTATTVAVFLPLAVVSGAAGELFRPFAVTIAVALVASLLVALTIVPVLSWWFLRDGSRRRRASTRTTGAPAAGASAVVAEQGDHPDRLQRAYLPLLRSSLAHPVVTLLAAVLVLAGTVGLATQLKTDFLGSTGQNTLTITQELPPGTDLATTDAAAARVEALLADVPEVVTSQLTIGSGDAATAAFAGGGSASTATFSVTLGLEDDATAVQERLRADVERLSAEAGGEDADPLGTVTVSAGAAGFGSSGVAVSVTAADEDVLREATAAVRELVTATAGTQDVTDDLAAALPTLQVVVDREAAAAAGLSEAAVGQAVAARVQGATVGRVQTATGPSDVVLRLGAAPADVEALRRLPLAGPAGVVPLSAVASVEEVAQPTSITRTDGQRSATVSAALGDTDLGTVTADLTAGLADLDLPAGAQASIGGASADQEEAFGQLGLALLAAIAIVYVIMVATFKSLAQPLVLLVSVPFAATGALAALVVTGTPLGLAALIGALMLVGVVVTNAIVLIDLVNQHRRAGEALVPAILEGARHRLRPILMTALATMLALTPMALGLTGGGAFISQPLALVVIGGLFSSTLLTLVLVPVLYLLVERLAARLHRSPAAEPAAR